MPKVSQESNNEGIDHDNYDRIRKSTGEDSLHLLPKVSQESNNEGIDHDNYDRIRKSTGEDSLHLLTPLHCQAVSDKSFKDNEINYPTLRHGSEESQESYIKYIISAHEAIRKSGKPNFTGCRFPIRSNMNIPFIERELEDYHDKVVIKFF